MEWSYVSVILTIALIYFTECKEYCLKETLHESCKDDEIMIVESAVYGRMKFGRCIARDYGYIGCGSDVTDVLAGKCSARRECELVNLETIFSDHHSCPKDLKSYLEADFTCQKVETAGATQCATKGHIEVPPSASGYLASITTQEHGFGSTICPWIITAQPGQRINITLYDFADYASISTQESGLGVLEDTKYCREYAMIKEGSSMKNVVACNQEERRQRVYTSTGHQVAVNIRDLVLDATPSVHFLLRYEVIGCVYPQVGADMFLIHLSEERVSVRCNYTIDNWTLHCVDGEWLGAWGNCTDSGAGAAASEAKVLPYGVSILIIIGVAVVICFGILLIGLIHINRKKRPRFRGKHRQLEPYATHTEMKVLQQQQHQQPSCSGARTPRTKHASLDRGYSPMMRTHLRTTVGGEYAHIWELRKPIPVATPEVPGGQTHPDKKQMADCGGATCPRKHTRCKSCSNIIDEDSQVSFSTFKPCPDHVYESPQQQQQHQQQQQQLQTCVAHACKCGTTHTCKKISPDKSQTRLFFEEENLGVLPTRDTSSQKQFRHEGQVSV